MSNLNFNDDNSPIVLSVDTSSLCAGFALARGQSLIASFNGDASTPHSRTFFLQINELLKIAGIDLSQVELLAAATGPGSFTGLRVGLAAMKGLAHSLNKPAIGVNSIDALALSTKVIGDVLVFIEAGRSEVYSGVRRVSQNGRIQPVGIDRVGTLTSVLSSDLAQQVLTVVGNIPQEVLVELPNWQVCLPSITIAEEVALRALSFFQSRTDCDLRPHYVRPSDAEIKRKD
ncbi:MAG TPA: tRNA (adenosine(37)-N6)-threonylcarbamoyltransferase complex dimerization subunit type 1 TsaB [Blastocatellia bacterium]|nr:tRNA (adenosine(37)-N6)-threonylcarbamoyltransferase complex dimerization subunit type 1 TsaB [Blastocatellia bacterium]